MGIQFAFEMFDGISGKAKAASASLATMAKSLQSTESALKATNRAIMQNRIAQLAPGITKQQTAVLNTIQRQNTAAKLRLQLTQQTEKAHERFASSAMGALGTIAGMTVGAIAGVTALGAAFLRTAGHMSDIRAVTMNFLTGQMGLVEAGRQMQLLEQFSTRFGVGLGEASTQYHRLVAQGFGSNEALTTMQATADVASVMGQDTAERLASDMAKLHNEGKADLRHIQMLSFAGVGMGDVLSEIAANRNRQAAPGSKRLESTDIREMIRARQITGDEVNSAALSTIQRRYSGGPDARLGARAVQTAATTLGGSIRRLDAQWEVFASHVGDSGAFQPVMRFMDRIGVSLEQATNQGSAFNLALQPLFAKLDTVDIAGIINRAVAAIPAFVGAISTVVGFVGDVATGLERINDLLHGRSQSGVSGITMPESQRGVGQTPETHQTWQQKAFNWLTGPSLGSQALDFMQANSGTTMAQARESGTQIASRVIEGFQSRAEIHSPSRVFTRLGSQMVDGLTAGMGLRLDEVEAMSSRVMDAAAGDVGGEFDMSGGNISVGDINVNVDGGSSEPEDIGREVARQLALILTRHAGSRGLRA